MTAKKYYPLAVLSLIFSTGIFIFGLIWGSRENGSLISGLCMGVGIMGISGSLQWLIRTLSADGEQGRRAEVEMNDERNCSIREKSAYASVKVMIPSMGAGAIALALSGHFIGTCVVAGLLLILSICMVVFSNYYSKRM